MTNLVVASHLETFNKFDRTSNMLSYVIDMVSACSYVSVISF